MCNGYHGIPVARTRSWHSNGWAVAVGFLRTATGRPVFNLSACLDGTWIRGAQCSHKRPWAQRAHAELGEYVSDNRTVPLSSHYTVSHSSYNLLFTVAPQLASGQVS